MNLIIERKSPSVSETILNVNTLIDELLKNDKFIKFFDNTDISKDLSTLIELKLNKQSILFNERFDKFIENNDFNKDQQLEFITLIVDLFDKEDIKIQDVHNTILEYFKSNKLRINEICTQISHIESSLINIDNDVKTIEKMTKFRFSITEVMLFIIIITNIISYIWQI